MNESGFEEAVGAGSCANRELKRVKVLTFFQRFLLAVNLWLAVAVFAFLVTIERFTADSLRQWIWGIALLIGCVVLGRGLWSFFSRGRFRAGMAVVFFFLFNVGVAAVFGLAILVAVLEDDALVEQFKTEVRWALLEHGASAQDESHLNFGVQSAGGRIDNLSGFETCMDELDRRDDTMRGEAIKLLGYTVGKYLAEDVVDDVMITVCLRFADGKVEVLRPYFFKSISNARKDLKKKEHEKIGYCELEKATYPKWSDPRITQKEQLQLVQAAMCRIDSRQALVLRRRKDGDSDRRIALDLGIKQGYVRKLHELGVKAVREEIESMTR